MVAVRRLTDNNIVATISVIISGNLRAPGSRATIFGPLEAVLDFAGSAVLQAVSKWPQCRWAGVFIIIDLISLSSILPL